MKDDVIILFFHDIYQTYNEYLGLRLSKENLERLQTDLEQIIYKYSLSNIISIMVTTENNNTIVLNLKPKNIFYREKFSHYAQSFNLLMKLRS